jgi:hypothetical protein
MSRVQLALNVANLNDSIEFYSQIFKTPAHKVRPGYANFQIENPPLKLVLIENPDERGAGTTGALNHLGVEVPSTGEVHDIIDYLTSCKGRDRRPMLPCQARQSLGSRPIGCALGVLCNHRRHIRWNDEGSSRGLLLITEVERCSRGRQVD